MVGRVGTNTGVADGVTSQCPAWPPIPRRLFPFEPVGNTPLRPQTIAAIHATAGSAPLEDAVPTPILCVPPKRARDEPTKVGY